MAETRTAPPVLYARVDPGLHLLFAAATQAAAVSKNAAIAEAVEAYTARVVAEDPDRVAEALSLHLRRPAPADARRDPDALAAFDEARAAERAACAAALDRIAELEPAAAAAAAAVRRAVAPEHAADDPAAGPARPARR